MSDGSEGQTATGAPQDEVEAFLNRSQRGGRLLVTLLYLGLLVPVAYLLVRTFIWPPTPARGLGELRNLALTFGPSLALAVGGWLLSLINLRRQWKAIDKLIPSGALADYRITEWVMAGLMDRRLRAQARSRLIDLLPRCPPARWDPLVSTKGFHPGDSWADLLIKELSAAKKRGFKGKDDPEFGRVVVRALGDIASPRAIEHLTTLSRTQPDTAVLWELQILAAEVLPLALQRVEARKQTAYLLHPVERGPAPSELLRSARSQSNADEEMLLHLPDGGGSEAGLQSAYATREVEAETQVGRRDG